LLAANSIGKGFSWGGLWAYIVDWCFS